MERPSHRYNGHVEGRPNQRYNGNEGEVRESRNGMNQEKIFQCKWAQGTCFSCGQAGHPVQEYRDPEVAGCQKCGSMNYWVRNCPETGRAQVRCGVVGHIAGMCWSTRHGANGNQGQEREVVNHGDCIGIQGASKCVEGNEGVPKSRNRVTGQSIVLKN